MQHFISTERETEYICSSRLLNSNQTSAAAIKTSFPLEVSNHKSWTLFCNAGAFTQFIRLTNLPLASVSGPSRPVFLHNICVNTNANLEYNLYNLNVKFV